MVCMSIVHSIVAYYTSYFSVYFINYIMFSIKYFATCTLYVHTYCHIFSGQCMLWLNVAAVVYASTNDKCRALGA